MGYHPWGLKEPDTTERLRDQGPGTRPGLEGEVLTTGPSGKSPKITLAPNNPCVKVAYLGQLVLNPIAGQ